MSKIVRRFPIDDFWNIGKSESWFSDMASQGLHLIKFGLTFVYFEKGKKSDTKYRIDVLYDKPSQEQLDIYKEYGWDFVAKTGFFYIFSSPRDSQAPELHTDSIEQGFTLNGLDRILKRNIIVLAVATLLMAGIVFALYYFDDEPFLSMVEWRFIQLIFSVIVYLHGTYSTTRNYLYFRNIKNALINGIEINHNENWKKGRLINTIVNTIVITIAAITVIMPVVQMVKSDEYTLAETKADLPIIRLADIEDNPNLQRQVYYDDEGIDFNNMVRYEWSPLAPTMYEIRERGVVESMRWADNSGEYSPSIHTKYYKLTSEKLAEGVLRDLMNKELYDPRYKEPERINNTKFNQLYVVEKNNSDPTKFIFASWDKNVIYIRYHGNIEVDKIISLLEEMEIRR